MKYIFTLLSFLVSTLVFGQSATEKADSLLNYLIPNNEHAVSVLVSKNDNVLYAKTKGIGKPEIPADDNTIFRIGSVTKQFTAVAILKLVEMNKLKLDDKLSLFIDDFPRGDEVTIHHLLTHTSGIKSYTDQHGFIDRVEKPVATNKLVKEIKGLGFEFNPGDQWKYNNSGYYLLGYIIELVSEQSYEEFLNQYLFEPAGMKNSGIYVNKSKYDNEAIGFEASDDEVKKSIDWNMTWAGGAGNIYSTCSDLAKWNKALFSYQIVNKELLDKALTPVMLNDGNTNNYGYGISTGKYRGQTRYAHSGGLHGFLSYLCYYPELDATVAVLSNASPVFRTIPANVALHLSDFLLKDDLVFDKEIAVNFDDYDKYLGEFAYQRGAIMTVTRSDDHLYAQLSGQMKFEIFPKGDHAFFWKIVEAEVQFHLNESGEVDYVIHRQGGGEFEAPKMEERIAIEMDSKIFNFYVGEYDLNGRIIKVWQENGQFFTQIEGQPAFTILPKSETRFFITTMNVDIEFDAGEITIYQAGNEIIAKKK